MPEVTGEPGRCGNFHELVTGLQVQVPRRNKNNVPADQGDVPEFLADVLGFLPEGI